MFSQLGEISAREWQVVFGPLLLILLVAVAIELPTKRIPNWLSLLALIWLGAARAAIGPGPIGQYLLGFLVGFAFFILFGFCYGIIGGGFAKLGAACMLAFTISESLLMSVILIAIGALLFQWRKFSSVRTYPGSVLLMLTIGIHLFLRLWGS